MACGFKPTHMCYSGAQIVGMASPFAVMKVEGNTEQSVYKVRRVFALPTDQHLAHKLLRASGNDRPQLSSSR